MQRIVVGIDGSAVAASALRWACHVASKSGAEIVAVSALQHPYSEVSPQQHELLLAERLGLLEDVWLDPISESGVQVKSLVQAGDPREVLFAVVRQEDADLLVLGRTGYSGGPGFLHLGSVCEYAAHRADCAVAVIPKGWTGPVKRIVVGVDGSAESLEALRWVGELAPALGAAMIAVHVEERRSDWARSIRPQDWQTEAELRLSQWTTDVASAGLDVELLLQRNLHPADALLGVTAARQGDLLAIGIRGLGRFTGLRAGGVALKVLHHATIPVALMPAQG